MFLKNLEIQGFKSFAPKTNFDFPAKIIAIVGPNGSGKSNIVDALKWVLGERARKNLRGNSLENLIFAGSPKKPPASLARVSLCFNNNTSLFPIDAEEVVLERKIDRSGNSQFFINNSETTLRDLAPTLARTKIGTRGLTIIGQGQSDLFVKSSPEERRMMIEELLGLKEFRIKKEEAEKRLQTSKTNMERVETIIEEITPHLKFLEKQKRRWDKRTQIEKDLQELENNYFSFHFHNLKRKLEKTKPSLQLLQEEKKKGELEVQSLENNLKTFDQKENHSSKIHELRRQIEQLFESKSNLASNIVRAETKLEIQAPTQNLSSNHSTQELKNTLEEIRKDIKIIINTDNLSKIKAKLGHWLSNLERLLVERKDVAVNPQNKAAEAEILKSIKTLKEESQKINTEIEKLKHEEKDLSAKQEKGNQNFRKQLEKIENQKSIIRDTERQIESHKFEKEKIQIKIDELEHQWTSLERKKHELDNLPEITHIESTNWQDAEKRMIRLRAELASIGTIDKETIKEVDETKQRYDFLSKELTDLETASENLKNLIQDLDKRIHTEFKSSFKKINDAFNTYFGTMFGGGKAALKLSGAGHNAISYGANPEVHPQDPMDSPTTTEKPAGIDIDISIPRKKIKHLDMLSGGEKSLVSLAALFSLISISSPPFLVLDEIDAALDDENTKRFSDLVKKFSNQTQFVLITHNKITMEIADILYGITMSGDGISKVLSLKLDKA